jgi:hypothetical protein
MMDRPPPDPAKLLSQWMEWENGELPPGRVMANLKTGGLRDVLEQLVAALSPGSAEGAGSEGQGSDAAGSEGGLG